MKELIDFVNKINLHYAQDKSFSGYFIKFIFLDFLYLFVFTFFFAFVLLLKPSFKRIFFSFVVIMFFIVISRLVAYYFFGVKFGLVFR